MMSYSVISIYEAITHYSFISFSVRNHLISDETDCRRNCEFVIGCQIRAHILTDDRRDPE